LTDVGIHNAFFDRIRQALAGGGKRTPAPPIPPAQAHAPGQDLGAQFGAALEAVGGRFVTVCSCSGLQGYLRGLIHHHGIRSVALSDAPLLGALGLPQWLSQEVECVLPAQSHRLPFADFKRSLAQVDLGVTGCEFAIADTGTVVISSAERNRLISLLPAIHVVVFTREQLIGELAEVLSRLREPSRSAVTLITGPSRSGDIEMTLTLGVHGPREMYAICVPESALP